MVPVLDTTWDRFLFCTEALLRYVPAPVASRLTGLSTNKLREWTTRRAFLQADVRPKGKGSPAQFTWQTVLALRVVVLLQDRFHLELEAHKGSFDRLHGLLRAKSFIALWGRRLALGADGGWSLLDWDAATPDGDALLLCLDPHLRALRDEFSLADQATGFQADLFSLPNVHRKRANPRTDGVETVAKQRPA